jgi:hypothetical protein
LIGRGAVRSLGREPPGAPAVATIRQAINSPASTSLKSQIAALTVSGLDDGSSLDTYESRALTVIQQNYTAVKQDVLAAVASSSTSS